MHLRIGTDGGMGLKPADRFTVPGCNRCHRRQHDMGERTFWDEIGIDPRPVADTLWAISSALLGVSSRDGELGYAVVVAARAMMRTI